MKLKFKYDKKEDIPSGYDALFEERDGAWVFVGVEGLRGPDDFERQQTALNAERQAHKDTKAKLARFKDLDPDKVAEQLDELEELRATVEAGNGNKDPAATDKLVEQRVKRQLAPIERERDQLKTKVSELEAANGQLSTTIKQGKIESALRAEAQKQGVLPTAVDDILLYGERVFDVDDAGKITVKDGVGFTPGLGPDLWLKDIQQKRPHWWPASQGGGANGGNGGGRDSGDNPWSAKGWSLTAQGQYVKQHGMEKAGQMAKLAGTSIGGPKPSAPLPGAAA